MSALHWRLTRQLTSLSRRSGGPWGVRRFSSQSGEEGPPKAVKPPDPFGFRALKRRWKGVLDDDDLASKAQRMKAEDAVSHAEKLAVRGIEREMKQRGRVRVPEENTFALDEVSRSTERELIEGFPVPSANEEELRRPEDYYWPQALDDTDGESLSGLPRFEQESSGRSCEGRLQKRGNFPLRCRKINLEELHDVNIPLIYKFLTPAGMIKPRRISGLCARCQRQVAKTIKRSRNIGVIPHTLSVEIFKQVPALEVPEILGEYEREDEELLGIAETQERKPASITERLRRLPSATI